jgi:hypothetical protein
VATRYKPRNALALVLYLVPAMAAAQYAGADGQLSGLLTGNAWCSFTYNARSGASAQERVVFTRDGQFVQQRGGETYSSGRSGTVAGQSRGGTRGQWRVNGGALHLSEDGANWASLPVQVTRNSSGSFIIKADGKEFMQCR